MPTMPAKSWTQRDHGQPKEKDTRWNFDRDAIHQHIHVERRRAWVLWKHFSSSLYTAPRVGLVVKPLDHYDNVQAFIPWETPIGHKKITAPSLPTGGGLEDDPGSGPEPAAV